MPQLQLPIFPAGTEEINRNVGVHCQDGKVVYVHGHLPVYQHKTSSLNEFRFFTSQMIDTGVVKTGEVAEAFGVPESTALSTLAPTVKRYLKVYRDEGPEGFFQQRQRHKSETKLTPEIKQQAQQLLAQGETVADVGRQLNVLPTTLHKAIRSKRLEVPLEVPVEKNSACGSRAGQHQKRAQRGRQASPNGHGCHPQFGAGGGVDGATGIGPGAL